MIEEFFERPYVRRRLKRGPLATVFGTYVDHLKRRGYGRVTIQQYVQALEHFGGGMVRRRRVLADVGPTLVAAFLTRHLAHCRCRCQRTRTVPTSRAALRQLLVVLTSRRAVQPVAAPSMTCVQAHQGHPRVSGGVVIMRSPESRLDPPLRRVPDDSA